MKLWGEDNFIRYAKKRRRIMSICNGTTPSAFEKGVKNAARNARDGRSNA